MSARLLHSRGAAALELLRQRAQTALDTWMQQWAINGPIPAAVTVTPLLDREQWQHHAYQQLRDAKGGLWIRAGAVDRAGLAQSVVGSDPQFAPVQVIEEIVDLAALARAEELRAALFGESAGLPAVEITDELPPDLLAFGCGAVGIVCSASGLHAIVDAGVWRAVLDRLLDEPLELLIGDHVVARGALVAFGDHFAVRVTETVTVAFDTERRSHSDR